ncbi:hypothetical protein I6J20_03555 [Corynebacterium glucuronolyticum]|nr:hypothetical protein HMPREF0294_2060 [Corynebacterium glucuronolyticum ATCC 51867]OFO48303.1 hypothetical protein HMPREF3044_00920 [Corynebacterium sp. HMSC073D01]QQU89682.1 hypothetical protein I6I68_06625 [Corynebacterium glucuronolyticum]QRO83730.1 hypothetical protein I6J20_03555 [Corynebacterium glucuronolyticum]
MESGDESKGYRVDYVSSPIFRGQTASAQCLWGTRWQVNRAKVMTPVLMRESTRLCSLVRSPDKEGRRTMFAVQATYKGKDKRRAEIVRRSAEALSTITDGPAFSVHNVETIVAPITSSESTVAVIMALLSSEQWLISLGCGSTAEEACEYAAVAAKRGPRSLPVTVATPDHEEIYEQAIVDAFVLIAFVLAKRSDQGREATGLMRTGLSQVEAAEELGITKQAMSQRLKAAGWDAENAGWELATRLLVQVSQAL